MSSIYAFLLGNIGVAYVFTRYTLEHGTRNNRISPVGLRQIAPMWQLWVSGFLQGWDGRHI